MGVSRCVRPTARREPKALHRAWVATAKLDEAHGPVAIGGVLGLGAGEQAPHVVMVIPHKRTASPTRPPRDLWEPMEPVLADAQPPLR